MHEDRLRGLIWYCDDWHDGQPSRLYRIGCRARQALRRRQYPYDPYRFPLGWRGTETYTRLLRAEVGI